MVIGSQKRCYKCGNYEPAGCMNDFPFVCSGCKKEEKEKIDLAEFCLYDEGMPENIKELPENILIDDFVVAINKDRTESTLTTVKNFFFEPIHNTDTSGQKMNIIAVLYGTTWTEAKKAYDVLLQLEWKPGQTDTVFNLTANEMYEVMSELDKLTFDLSSRYGVEDLERGVYKLLDVLRGVCNAKNSW